VRKEQATATAKANAGVLRFAQNDKGLGLVVLKFGDEHV
jgi:hypothetical protein